MEKELQQVNCPLNDERVIAMFGGVCGATYDCEGIPVFDTEFVKSIISKVTIQNFDDICKVIALKKGTDVWLNNACALLENDMCTFQDVIGCKEDVLEYLERKNMDLESCSRIADEVARGSLSAGSINLMKECGVSDWYIDSCSKIKYLVTREEAEESAMQSYQLAYGKCYHI